MSEASAVTSCCAGLLRGDGSGLAVFDDEAGAGGHRGAGGGHEFDDPVIRCPRRRGDDVADVAALAVDELDVRVLGELDGVARVLVDAVAPGGDRRADQFGGHGPEWNRYQYHCSGRRP